LLEIEVCPSSTRLQAAAGPASSRGRTGPPRGGEQGHPSRWRAAAAAADGWTSLALVDGCRGSFLRWEVCPSSCSTLSPIAIEDPPGPLAEANGEPRGGGTVGWWRDGAGTAGRRGVLGRRGGKAPWDGWGLRGRRCCGTTGNSRVLRATAESTNPSIGWMPIALGRLAMGIGEGADDGWILVCGLPLTSQFRPIHINGKFW